MASPQDGSLHRTLVGFVYRQQILSRVYLTSHCCFLLI